MSHLVMRVGNRLPQLRAQALNEFGLPMSVTGYVAYLVIVSHDSDLVFGLPSPYMANCVIANAATGVVTYDWLATEMNNATPGTYSVTVRFVNIANPTLMFEVPNRLTANLIIRPGVTGYNYMVDANGELVLTGDNQPIEVT